MIPYIAEFIGTTIIVILGDGVCANVFLTRSGMNGPVLVQVSFGWGCAVFLPAFPSGAVSGGHFNPALTIAMASIGKFAWASVPGYIIAQIAGGIFGGILVYLLFADHFNSTEDAGVIRGCFCTSPSIRNIPRNFLSEIIGTFILVFSILGVGNVTGAGNVGVNYMLVFGIITSIGMSLGGLTGYAINPARDLGPRIAHALMPMKYKGGSDWSYGLSVPVFGPIIGGLLAAALYFFMFIQK